MYNNLSKNYPCIHYIEEQRSMVMADLMNFVKDLIEMEEKKKNGKIL